MLKRGAMVILGVLLMAQAPMAQAPSASPPPTVQSQNPPPAAETRRADYDRWTLLSVEAAAFFTGLLFLVGAAQAALFVWQLRQIAQQGKLARDEFMATHRPRIRVRLLQVKPLVIGKPVEIEYVVANVGENDAVRIQSEITLKLMAGNPPKEQSWSGEFSIPDVMTGECVIPRHVTGAIVGADWVGVLSNPKGAVRIQGTITYQEKSGIKRKTGFYRACSDGLDRFSRFGNEDIQRDYEYED